MNNVTSLAMCILLTVFISPASAYQPLKDDTAGGNPTLPKATVKKVYIQDGPAGSGFKDQAKEAIEKWKAELATQGVQLEIQAGPPPQAPLDLKKYNEEVEKFNKDPNPDMANYPEITKYQAKTCTISVYFDTKENIAKRGGGSQSGFTRNAWSFDDNGHADKIEISDVFILSDPPGADAEVKKRSIYNVTLHEFGHVAGLDHYTPGQLTNGGKVMQNDALLHDAKLELGEEEKKGIKGVYGATPNMKVEDGAQKKESSFLPDFIRQHIPLGVPTVWAYTYDLTWLGGSEASYFQVQKGTAPIFFAFGSEGLDDWLYRDSENYLEFFADQNYLGNQVFSGRLEFYSDAPPGQGWLVASGEAHVGVAPVPEPMSFLLLGGGLVGAAVMGRKREMKVGKG